MILILTEKNDAHSSALIKLLNKDNIEYFRFNLDVYSLERTFVTFENNEWVIKTKNKSINLKNICCVWNRRTFVQLMLDEQNKDYKFNIWKNEWNKTLLGIYYFLRDKYWINYYRNNHKAENKYLQMELAKSVGLRCPNFILSNEKKAINNFIEKYQKVVIKLMNQDFYKVGENKFKGFYVNILKKEDMNDFFEREENPVFVQEYIEKKYEVRYTIVNKEHFVCKIDSQSSNISKIDWRRYDLAHTPHSIIEPPHEIKIKIELFMSKLNLIYGAFDFIVDENDDWHFLEINPSGQYLWIEDLTGLKITESIKNNLLSSYY